MFCSNCGNKVEDVWLKCPYCGKDLRESVQENETVEATGDDNTQVVAETGDGGLERRGAANSEQARDTDIQKKPAHQKRKRWIGLCLIIGIVAVLFTILSVLVYNGGSRRTIKKLQEFTTVLKEDDKYSFQYAGGSCGEKNGWTLVYTTENEFVKFNEDAVEICFAETAGIGNSIEYGSFSYDIDENEIRIYFDPEETVDNISVINYRIYDEKFTALSRGDRIELSDELLDVIDECGLVRIMEYDIKNFKAKMSESGLKYREIEDLQYEDIESYFQKHSRMTPTIWKGKNRKAEKTWDLMAGSYTFASGTGGWETELEIAEDGTFTGKYTDFDVADVGGRYPDGTVYICKFKGRFADVEREDTYTYSMRLAYLETEGTEGDRYYQDNVRYIYASPHGLENADRFMFYLPGKRMRDLPEMFIGWCRAFFSVSEVNTLPYRGIYNLTGEFGFVEWSEKE